MAKSAEVVKAPAAQVAAVQAAIDSFLSTAASLIRNPEAEGQYDIGSLIQRYMAADAEALLAERGAIGMKTLIGDVIRIDGVEALVESDYDNVAKDGTIVGMPCYVVLNTNKGVVTCGGAEVVVKSVVLELKHRSSEEAFTWPVWVRVTSDETKKGFTVLGYHQVDEPLPSF